MIKKILAIIAALACAGAIVEFIPESAPAVAAGSSPGARSHGTSTSGRVESAVADAARIAERLGTICSQAWPYYEPACLHDDRRSDGKVRLVRVIVANGSITGSTLPTQP